MKRIPKGHRGGPGNSLRRQMQKDRTKWSTQSTKATRLKSAHRILKGQLKRSGQNMCMSEHRAIEVLRGR